MSEGSRIPRGIDDYNSYINNTTPYLKTGTPTNAERLGVSTEELAKMGYGIVLYANAALQGAVAGMQRALGVLKNEGHIQEDPNLVAPFAERQRLVNKPIWDALEKKYQ